MLGQTLKALHDEAADVRREARPHSESFLRLDFGVSLWQVRDAHEAAERQLVHVVPDVLAHEDVGLDGCDSSIDLEVEPNQVIVVQQKQTIQLLVQFLRESLHSQVGNFRLYNPQEAVQQFALHLYHKLMVQLILRRD